MEQIRKVVLVLNIGNDVQIIKCKHPYGGVKNSVLDGIW